MPPPPPPPLLLLLQVLEWLVGGTNTHTNSKGDDAAAALAAAARAWDGVLVFDECHKAKNFAPGMEAQSTKVCVKGVGFAGCDVVKVVVSCMLAVVCCR